MKRSSLAKPLSLLMSTSHIQKKDA